MNFELVATCMFGLEKLVGEEIDALGLKRTETMDGRVTFLGTELDVARANVNLRCAERVYIKVGSFPARTFTELFDGVYSLEWENYIEKEYAFPVKGHAIKSALYSLPDCQSIIKKAVSKRLGEKYHSSWLAESGQTSQIEFFIFKDIANLMIDTSGIALHKRGYRPQAGSAPLRETLAAALVKISRPREDILLWDPFCGSGTIGIEAAMIMSAKAPGLYRRFAGEKLNIIGSQNYTLAREEARGNIVTDCKYEVYSSDIDEKVLDIARENARRADVLKYMKIFSADARNIKKPQDRRGTLICNPPYGERMLEMSEAEALYRSIGKNFSTFSPWQIYVLTANDTFPRHYGRRADKVRKLYNGMIPCNLYQYFKPTL